MNFAEYTDLVGLMKRLWPASKGNGLGAADAALKTLAANFPLWADLDHDQAVNAVYELRHAGHRWQPSADEVRRHLGGDQPGPRGWPWWHRAITDALDAYRTTPPAAPTFEELDDGSVRVVHQRASWDADVPGPVLELLAQFGGVATFLERWHDSYFRHEVRTFVESEDTPVGAARGTGRDLVALYGAVRASLPSGSREALPALSGELVAPQLPS